MIKRFLSTTDLKLLALGLMVLDHLYYFFSFSGRIPVWFAYLGRSSLPLFIFALTEGFYHTRNRKKYLLRLFLAYLLMELSRRGLMIFLPRPDGFILGSNIFGTLLLILLFLYSLEELKKNPPAGKFYRYTTLLLALAPLMFLVEGGPPFIVLGIVLYFTRSQRLPQAVTYVLWCALFWLPQASIRWMMVFAVLPMLLYDGRKGKGYQRFFYVFYPLHLWIFYVLSVLFYGSLAS